MFAKRSLLLNNLNLNNNNNNDNGVGGKCLHNHEKCMESVSMLLKYAVILLQYVFRILNNVSDETGSPIIRTEVPDKFVK